VTRARGSGRARARPGTGCARRRLVRAPAWRPRWPPAGRGREAGGTGRAWRRGRQDRPRPHRVRRRGHAGRRTAGGGRWSAAGRGRGRDPAAGGQASHRYRAADHQPACRPSRPSFGHECLLFLLPARRSSTRRWPRLTGEPGRHLPGGSQRAINSRR